MSVRSQDVVERALELSQADGCIVIAHEGSNVNLRWAGNTLTTNGLARSRELTVIATVGGSTGTAAGIVGRSNVGLDEVEKVVRLAEQSARTNEAAEDAAPLVEGRAADDWAEAPEETSAAVLSNFSQSLGQAFERARAAGRELFGYAEHDVTTTYLGTSTGVRLRHVQPSGRAEITGKSAGRTGSSWVGSSTRDFTGRRRAHARRRARAPARMGRATGRGRARAAGRRCCHRRR
jgi:predicted Zn-dependent protease